MHRQRKHERSRVDKKLKEIPDGLRFQQWIDDIERLLSPDFIHDLSSSWMIDCIIDFHHCHYRHLPWAQETQLAHSITLIQGREKEDGKRQAL
jgi:hypothetical protein